LARKAAGAIDDLKKLLVKTNDADPNGELRTLAREAGVGFQDVEETIAPNPESPFSTVQVKRITSPPLEKLGMVFSQIASGPSER
jgi:hypothetical protein